LVQHYQWIALETGIDLNATISGRTPPEPPQFWPHRLGPVNGDFGVF
jgi:hypothetical protein